MTNKNLDIDGDMRREMGEKEYGSWGKNSVHFNIEGQTQVKELVSEMKKMKHYRPSSKKSHYYSYRHEFMSVGPSIVIRAQI